MNELMKFYGILEVYSAAKLSPRLVESEMAVEILQQLENPECRTYYEDTAKYPLAADLRTRLLNGRSAPEVAGHVDQMAFRTFLGLVLDFDRQHSISGLSQKIRHDRDSTLAVIANALTEPTRLLNSVYGKVRHNVEADVMRGLIDLLEFSRQFRTLLNSQSDDNLQRAMRNYFAQWFGGGPAALTELPSMLISSITTWSSREFNSNQDRAQFLVEMAEVKGDLSFLLDSFGNVTTTSEVFISTRSLYTLPPIEDRLEEVLRRVIAKEGINWSEWKFRVLSPGATRVWANLIKRFGKATDTALREQVAVALFHEGTSLGRLTRRDVKVVVYDELLKRFSSTTEATLKGQVVQALLEKGAALRGLRRFHEALEVFDNLIETFGSSSESALRLGVAKALLEKAIALRRLNRFDDAMAVYDELVTRFGNATDSSFRERVAEALSRKGADLYHMKRYHEGIAVYDELIKMFGGSGETIFESDVAGALFMKGACLVQVERSEEAIVVYDDLVERFGNATKRMAQVLVARALFKKGVILDRQGRIELAILSYCAAWKRRTSLIRFELEKLRTSLVILGKPPESCE